MKKLLKLTCILCSVLSLNAQTYVVDFSQMTWLDINPNLLVNGMLSVDLDNDSNNDLQFLQVSMPFDSNVYEYTQIGCYGAGTHLFTADTIQYFAGIDCPNYSDSPKVLVRSFHSNDIISNTNSFSSNAYYNYYDSSANCYYYPRVSVFTQTSTDTVYTGVLIGANCYFLWFIEPNVLDGYYISNNTPLGIESKENDLSAYVYDNVLYIKSLNSNKKIKVDVFNLLGKKVLELLESNYFSEQQFNIPLTLEKGCYILSLITEEGKQKTAKVIID